MHCGHGYRCRRRVGSVSGLKEGGILLLTDEERKRFVEWLKQDALSNDLLAKQMDGMPHLAPLAKQKRMLAMSETIVAKELEKAEQWSL